jgi:hypothetical protein
MKWLPLPSVPIWLTQFVEALEGLDAVGDACRSAPPAGSANGSAAWVQGAVVAVLIASDRHVAADLIEDARSVPIDRADRPSSEVRAAAMPQPISTPTAAGMMACRWRSRCRWSHPGRHGHRAWRRYDGG